MSRELDRQDQALALASQNPDIGVFSKEIENSDSGARRFFSVARTKLWPLYSQMPWKFVYEVIANFMFAKLYFDLEFSLNNLDCKTRLDGLQMTLALIQLISDYLCLEYNTISHKKNILILESTHQDKFSIHLIFNDVIFQSNLQMGVFVRNFLSTLSEEYLNLFFVRANNLTRKLFIDLSVYSSNQNFRIFLSCKQSKNVPLLPSSIDEFCRGKSDDQIFLASLITNCNAQNILQLPQTFPVQQFKQKQINSESPYAPFLESYVADLIFPRWIRGWHLGEKNRIQFLIGGSRYCERVKREHKSNNVYLEIDLFLGISYFKCFDPHCWGWRSDVTRIPVEARPWLNLFTDEF